jgi:hypothetical protein
VPGEFLRSAGSAWVVDFGHTGPTTLYRRL